MQVDEQTLARMTRNEADMAFKRRVRTIFEWVPPPDDETAVILDAGCGRGFYLNYYRYVSKVKLVGLELDEIIIRKAQTNVGDLPDITLVQANLYHLPFPDNTFHAVIMSEILEHVDDDARALREAYRVLKPGGVVVMTVPNANYPFWWDPINKMLESVFKRKIRRGPLAGIWANHVRLYTLPELREPVQAAGFTIEAERAFTHYSFPFIHNLVYGLGKPLLESGFMPKRMATAADRTTFDDNQGSLWNPVNLGLAVLNFFDKPNKMDEPLDRSTVNLCMKARKTP
ncbi:MAG: class I SAM-dependent methyltransferase [Anaerolineales bacterium]|nr:class I SAM-dependent methyltransferase [Anaerolineales bacterium]